MKRLCRIRMVWWVSAGCAVAMLIVVVYASLRGWTPGKVERLVNQQLPTGSNRATIEAFLDARGWPRSYGGPENAVYAEWAGLNAKDVSRVAGVVFGEVPDPNVGPFDTGSITVLFFLDQDDRLIRSWVKVWILGL